MVTIPRAQSAVQGIHLDPGLPVSRPCCFRPTVCSWVVAAYTVRHFLQNSTALGAASSDGDVAIVAAVEEPIPQTCPFEAASVASVASVVPTIWLGQPASFDHQHIFAFVHLLETEGETLAISVQLVDLSAC